MTQMYTCFWTQSRVITLGHFSTGIKLDKIPAFSTQSKSFKTGLVVDGQTTVIFFFLLISLRNENEKNDE
jgi:hypothetical protein